MTDLPPDVERLGVLRAISGDEHYLEALDVAIEAAKLGLRVDELLPMLRAWHMLGALGMQPREGQGTFAWGREHGLISDAEVAEAQQLDLLGMRDD